MTAEQRKEFVDRCPRKVYKYNDQKDIVEIENASECTLCIECSRYTDKLKLERAVHIGENDNKFFFTVESTGSLPPDDIVRKALEILKTKVAKFRNEMNLSA